MIQIEVNFETLKALRTFKVECPNIRIIRVLLLYKPSVLKATNREAVCLAVGGTEALKIARAQAMRPGEGSGILCSRPKVSA
jgi:hypothetical protein